ncbi:hypothetical protein SDC9_93816 [bioreactor metagenome]|uniref:Uncharacterized protein n=1 Tax=bioreactor metagenome TaxID=1076179 RepID=A0A645A306_9ZZZZ
MMLQRYSQSRAKVVEPVAAEGRLRDMPAGLFQRANIAPVFGKEILPQQRLANDRQVEQRIMRDEQTAREIRLNRRPELIQAGLVLNIRRADTVDRNISRVKLIAWVHEIVQPDGVSLAIHADDADGTDRAGITVGRFHVHSGKGIKFVPIK